jgi:hypothetical protein
MALAYNVKKLATITGNGSTAIEDADDYYEHAFYVRLNSGTATITIEGSADGSNFQAVATAITASDVIYVTGAHPNLRVTVSASSTPSIEIDVVQFGGDPLVGR